MAKQHRREKAKPRKKQTQKTTQPQKPKQSLKTFLKSGYGIVTIFVVLVGVPMGIEWLINSFHKTLTSLPEQWNEKNYIKGIFIPEHIVSTYPYFNIQLGESVSTKVALNLIKEGYIFRPPGITVNNTAPFELKMLLKNNRLFFSSLFYDINGDYVGRMDFGKWEIKNDQISYYPANDNTAFEVLGKQRKVIFQIKYLYPNTLQFKGYSIIGSTIIVINEGVDMFSNKDEESVRAAIEEIKHIPSLIDTSIH